MERNELRAEWVRKGYSSMRSFSTALGMGYETFKGKYYGRTRLTVDDVKKMAEVLNLSALDVTRIFFGDSVAK